ncbi:MAG: hypothetical protein UV82_C0005G0019 [Candidatus Magasanikbacteria bacterium GW2011_GWD2_43_18]|nr:MAG: hypothetical protein UV18_C0005G0202 [Candidatus Magasanikbacteria bacterium GW2011_GWC2_42_27]KKT04781.1 MAG: hypothetical protein UV82_C0005G0019 [Candidatus Magasanikbacteria bacterium GW2011_GWD2_43_18]KKT25861.1 MAG: hypothetical protein UW10_C0003G0022 [Candidatus Magasanikbacteria bacterium GW2011_GWA2_43_9]
MILPPIGEFSDRVGDLQPLGADADVLRELEAGLTPPLAATAPGLDGHVGARRARRRLE